MSVFQVKPVGLSSHVKLHLEEEEHGDSMNSLSVSKGHCHRDIDEVYQPILVHISFDALKEEGCMRTCKKRHQRCSSPVDAYTKTTCWADHVEKPIDLKECTNTEANQYVKNLLRYLELGNTNLFVSNHVVVLRHGTEIYRTLWKPLTFQAHHYFVLETDSRLFDMRDIVDPKSV